MAAHVVGTLGDIAGGRAELLTAPDSPERQARVRAGRSAEELADELVATGRAHPMELGLDRSVDVYA